MVLTVNRKLKMGDIASLKSARTTAKIILTMKLNEIKVALAVDGLSTVNKEDVIQQYKKFREKSEIYAEAALKAETETQEDLDDHFQAQQNEYIAVMRDLRDAVRQNIKPQIKTEVSHEKSSVPSVDVTRDELLSALSLNTSEYIHATI